MTAARQAPHDDVARLAGGGVGGVYRRLASAVAAALPDAIRWFSKPAGESYAAFAGRLPPGEAWQRQLVLGPAPEFCILGAAPAGIEAAAVRARLVVDPA